jgi:hypothetical protein
MRACAWCEGSHSHVKPPCSLGGCEAAKRDSTIDSRSEWVVVVFGAAAVASALRKAVLRAPVFRRPFRNAGCVPTAPPVIAPGMRRPGADAHDVHEKTMVGSSPRTRLRVAMAAARGRLKQRDRELMYVPAWRLAERAAAGGGR